MKKIMMLLLLSPILTMCQPLELRGKVINEKNDPVNGASVQIRSAQKIHRAVQTNAAGEFRIQGINLNDTLLISFVGYKPFTEIIDHTSFATELLIKLEPVGQEMEHVTISTGYQRIPRERATGSFAFISEETLDERISTGILTRLDGITPSLLFDHRPGSDEKLQLRGISSLWSNSMPLIILDNFPFEGDLNTINPNDIESITVLKDAAAASIWGSRAGNGVIVITTKKGKAGQVPQVSFNANYSLFAKPNLDDLHYIPSADFIEFETFLFDKGYFNSDINNTSSRPPLSPAVEILLKKRNGIITASEAEAELNKLKNLDVRDDFNDYLYRNALNRQLSLSVSGGGPVNRYYFSTGYDNNIESRVGNHYNRFTLRLDNTLSLIKDLEFNISLMHTSAWSQANHPGDYGSYNFGRRNLYPYARLADESGNPVSIEKDYRPAFTDTAGGGKLLPWNYSPLQELELADNNTRSGDFLINTSLQYHISPSLNITAAYRWHQMNSERLNHNSIETYFTRNMVNRYTQMVNNTPKYIVPMGGILDEYTAAMNAHNLRGQASFQQTFSQHHQVNAIAGAEIQQMISTSGSRRIYGYNNENLSFFEVDYTTSYPIYGGLSSALRIPSITSFGKRTHRAVSVYANSAYTYKNRYTFSLSARRDASNLFGVKSNQKWTPLWSAGSLWNISRENFYNIRWLPLLNFRFTYGFSGNTITDVSGLTTIVYQDASSSVMNLPFARIANAPNPHLRAEKVGMMNWGIDFGLPGNRISGSIEYYIKNTKDLLGSQSLDQTTGLSSYVTNSAHISGKGIDMEIHSKNITGNFSWESALLFSYNTLKVTKYLRSSPDVASSFTSSGMQLTPREGLHPYTVISYPWAGLDPQTGNPQGYLNGAVSQDYSAMRSMPFSGLVVHGVAIPPYFGALKNAVSYKGLSLDFNITYRFGHYFRLPAINYTQLMSQYLMHNDYMNRWQQPGDELNTTVPSFIYPANSLRESFYTNSAAIVHKAGIVKLEYVTLSYTPVPGKQTRSPFRKMQFQVYANNLNLVLWNASKLSIDPEYPYQLRPPASVSFAVKTIF